MSALLLDNYANNSSPALTCDDAPSAVDFRAIRYARRSGIQRETTLPRLAKCGCCRTSHYVAVRFTEGVAGFSGLATCGSVWVCPVCSAKIAAVRQQKIQAALMAWYLLGGHVAFSTFTMRHAKGDGLVALWDALSGSWGSVTSGKSWQLAQDRFSVCGWLRLVEVTIGSNGWHVHIHALLFLYGDATPSSHRALHGWMTDRWISALDRRGFQALTGAQDSQRVQGVGALQAVADYFTKSTDRGTYREGTPGDPEGRAQGVPARPSGAPGIPEDHARGLALEFSRSHTKSTRSAFTTLPPFSLLDLVLEDGDADALDLWHEWESGSFGRRQLTWSHGMLATLALADDPDDEVIAAEVPGTDLDDLLFITPDGWWSMLDRPHLIPRVLTVTEAGGFVALRALLDSERVAYVLSREGVN